MWADIRCPWCWMGHRRLNEAVRRSGNAVRVQHRSFLLEPQGPEAGRRTVGQVAISEWGMTQAQWAARRAHIEQSAHTDGLSIRIDTARTIDSRDAHRLLKLAAARGHADAAWEAMFAAHLELNQDLEDWDILIRIGVEVGLDRAEILALADSDVFGAEVLADHREAQSRGIDAIPAVVIGDRLLAGSRSVSELEGFVGTPGTEAVV